MRFLGFSSLASHEHFTKKCSYYITINFQSILRTDHQKSDQGFYHITINFQSILRTYLQKSEQGSYYLTINFQSILRTDHQKSDQDFYYITINFPYFTSRSLVVLARLQ